MLREIWVVTARGDDRSLSKRVEAALGAKGFAVEAKSFEQIPPLEELADTFIVAVIGRGSLDSRAFAGVATRAKLNNQLCFATSDEDLTLPDAFDNVAVFELAESAQGPSSKEWRRFLSYIASRVSPQPLHLGRRAVIVSALSTVSLAALAYASRAPAGGFVWTNEADIPLSDFDRMAPRRPVSKSALLVAIEDYDVNQWAELKHPISDVGRINGLLNDKGFETTFLANPDLSTLSAAVSDWKPENNVDLGIVYLAGHGLHVGRSYLVPSNVDFPYNIFDSSVDRDRLLVERYYPVDRVIEELRGHFELLFVVVDACRTNPLLQPAQAPFVRDQVSASNPAQANSQLRGVPSTTGSLYGEWRETQSGETVVFYSASEGHPAGDGEAEHSPFAAEFIGALQRPFIDVETLYKTVVAGVRRATHDAQRPQVYTYFGAKFFLD
jgi:hypothetical protein